MEQYALLIIFAAMVVIWWVTWAPWKPRDQAPQDQDDDLPPPPKRRR